MASKAAAIAERKRVLRILIIDSDLDDVRRVREHLAAGGDFVTHAARTVDEARTLLDGGLFDVALVDSGIWTSQGSDLARHLRERRNDVAVVLLTSDENERDALPALKLGAHDFISKSHLEEGGQLILRIEGAYDENRSLRRRDTMVRWLEREARTDHLTGLYNRHAFDERLREACQKAREERRPVTLVMVDICGTRIVNEVHGHDIGDDMIRRAALGIARCIRGADTAARIGGDDFGIIIPDGDLALGRLIARRIAQEVERLNSSEWLDQVPVTLTLGVASGVSCEPGELFAAADQQLSDHKTVRPMISVLRMHEESNGPFVA
ncbi:MAG: diguanylate cyclase [Dehalococcoidia bacterium]|jgi:diguanylate cyclase (GGDEF)-like protein|uniref:GGDEF domain-containing protein n=1 Tax=Candidatus Amarobacter glycogenicus TaxID=3140699 RepID=UPI001D274D07|nr:diguanylate cyclase [Dehalococcoidia bacterium]MBK7726432.1 diguanylate cyclase [Dehalococcoidia bacterium]MBK8559914.1 diguanylate cyclase [Dehalococcoidia bacterium]MBK9611240.1 diguanylate cyclase [Dehalococcoidia bacterium]